MKNILNYALSNALLLQFADIKLYQLEGVLMAVKFAHAQIG